MGMPPNETQQRQPAFMHLARQSQHAWTMSQQALSPLVQVRQTPSSVIEHSHLHMARLHWHMVMPFIVQQQQHMPSASILHMFCNMVQATSSSHEQLIFMPPVHFSTLIVHRGTMHTFPMVGDIVGIAGIEEGGIVPVAPAIVERSNIIIVDIDSLLCSGACLTKSWQ